MVQGLEHPSSKKKVRELGGFSSRKQGRAGQMSSMALNLRWEVLWLNASQQLGPYVRLQKRKGRLKVRSILG